jgi:hypothetical protein
LGGAQTPKQGYRGIDGDQLSNCKFRCDEFLKDTLHGFWVINLRPGNRPIKDLS